MPGDPPSTSAAPETAPPTVPPYAAFQHRDFRLYQTARFLATIGMQMQSVAVGWQIYAITSRPVDLGYAGLAQFVPAFLLSIVTGHVADRVNRKRLLVACYAGITLCQVLLLGRTLWGHGVWEIYAILVLLGVARAFAGPAAQALMPNLVPTEHFPNAVAWSSSIWQTATIVGPAAGGLVYGAAQWARGGADDGRSAAAVYAGSAALIGVAALFLAVVRARIVKADAGPSGLARLLAGVRYVMEKKVILGAISLDLFAVLLGGAVALLPIYAKDVLHTGPWGLGFLRSGPAIGAALMAFWVAHRPIKRHAGRSMLAWVALFGVATIAFGVSRNFLLSLLALVVAGGADMVSVVIRQTLVQLSTPDAMRGRVSAVNLVFVGASNELGEFESGLTAQWLGAVPAVIAGGCGTLLVVALWSLFFPALRDVDRLTDIAVPD